MIELAADRTVCIGSGMCVLTCSDVFDQSDSDGLVILGSAQDGHDPDADRHTLVVPDEHAESVRQAVHSCPSGALSLNEQ